VIIIRPIEVVPLPLDDPYAIMTASNVPEDDHPAWDIGESYDLGDTVIHQQRIWESLGGYNIGNDPVDSPDDWLLLGATNRWRLLDGGTGSLTTNPESIEITLEPTDQVANGVAFFNVDASEIQIDVYNGSTLTYTATLEIFAGLSESNWWAYFFGESVGAFDPARDLVDLGLPSIFSPRIEISIRNPGGTAACGLIVIGRQQPLGTTVYGSSVGIRDYSRKDVDEFGNFSVVQRRFAKTADFDVVIRTRDVASLQRALAGRRALPTVYIGAEDASFDAAQQIHEETIIYGFYRDFSIVLGDRVESRCTIDIEGL
jgi:hypothetical protein